MDEVEFWQDVATAAKDGNKKERAEQISFNFKPVSKNFTNAENLSFEGMIDALENARDSLDDLWKNEQIDPPYSEERMKHLFEVFGKYYFIFCILCFSKVIFGYFSGTTSSTSSSTSTSSTSSTLAAFVLLLLNAYNSLIRKLYLSIEERIG